VGEVSIGAVIDGGRFKVIDGIAPKRGKGAEGGLGWWRMPLGLDGLGAAVLNRGGASFLDKMANVANTGNAANGADVRPANAGNAANVANVAPANVANVANAASVANAANGANGVGRYGLGAGRGDCRWLSLGGCPGEWGMRPQPRR